MNEHLRELPTETLIGLATLTGVLRVQQHLRALETPMLRELLLLAEQRSNAAVASFVREELERRA